LLEDNKDIVLWLHNNPNEFLPPVNLASFRNPALHNKIKCVITVSNYAKQKLVEQSGISADKVVTIYNAVDDIPLTASDSLKAIKDGETMEQNNNVNRYRGE